MSKKTYKLSSGTVIDMDSLRIQNEKTVAVGNMRVNAGGDKIGKGGSIEKAKAVRADNNYKTTVAKVSLKPSVLPETASSEIGAVPDTESTKETTKKVKAQKNKKTTEIELPDGSIQIIKEGDDV